MTIEEAVKDAEFRDRVADFPQPRGDMFVLHRRRDGQMELVEILSASPEMGGKGRLQRLRESASERVILLL